MMGRAEALPIMLLSFPADASAQTQLRRNLDLKLRLDNKCKLFILNCFGGWMMDEKLRFVFDYERDVQTMAELCAASGSRAKPAMSGCGATASTECRDWWN
jgi:hypothetical protein